MSDTPKKQLQSMDVAEEKKKRLKELFPEVFDEEHIDFDQLKRVLGQWIDPGKERFGLNWPGKAECLKMIQSPAKGTLKPCRTESVDWDTTGNLFIEGDNLEVLKLLQKAYFGKVKMIYIDPPYNTGKEFIYPDKYSESLDTYLRYTGQKDSNGHEFSTNSDTNGKFHSRWLNMMYPRLYLAKNFLREDGVIFISIDDNEQANLRKLCDQIFGEENFIGNFAWRKKAGAGADSKLFFRQHEYVLFYAKNIINIQEFFQPLTDKQKKEYSNPDNDKRGLWAKTDLRRTGDNDPTRTYEVVSPTGQKHKHCWTYTQENFKKLVAENLIWWGQDGNQLPKRKRFLKDKQGLTPRSWIDSILTSEGKKDLDAIDLDCFQYPKPKDLIKLFVQIATSKEDLVMDFFAGSATTAHAIMQLNMEDGGNRKYIMVQIPEHIDKKSQAYQDSYKTIADIGKERIRRAIKKIKNENPKLDLGFKVLKLNKSCFKEWDDSLVNEQLLLKRIEKYTDDLDSNVTDEDILYEVILKEGLSPATPIKTLNILDTTVYSLEDGLLLICLDRKIKEEFILRLADQIAKTLPIPKSVIFLDAGFESDVLKTNTVETFKTKSHHIERTINFSTV